MRDPEITREYGATILKFEFKDYDSGYEVPVRMGIDNDSITLEFSNGAELRINQIGGPEFEVDFWKDFDQTTPEEHFDFVLEDE